VVGVSLGVRTIVKQIEDVQISPEFFTDL